jgi:nucleoid-associated protein YgaU
MAVATSVAVIGGAALMLLPAFDPDVTPEMSALLPTQPGPTAPPGAGDAALSPGAAGPGAEEGGPAAIPHPAFDVVRAEADGRVLVAGTAAAGHHVRVEVDRRPQAAGRADPRGSFVLFLELPRAFAPRVLDLVATGPDGTERRSVESIVLAPPRLGEEPAPDLALAPPEDPAPELALARPQAPALPETDGNTPETRLSDEAQPAGIEEENPEPQALAAAPAEQGGNAAQAPVIAGETAPGSAALPLAQAGRPLSPQVPGAQADAARAAPAAQSAQSAETAPVAQAAERAPAPRAADSASGPAVEAAAGAAAAPVAAAPGAAAPSGGAAQRAGPPGTARAVARAPAVLIAGEQGVRLMQPSAPGRAADRVVVDVISYDADGTVRLEGRGAPPPPAVDRVRIYLDNAPVQDAPIAEDGTWRIPLTDVATGVYTLRVDQIDPAGNVVSRFETPFKREDPAELARLSAESPQAEGQVKASVITVQPGYTLWGIADDRYGSGLDYVAIFEANDDQIRDPDLIYPGQVFDLPDLPVSPGQPDPAGDDE